MADGIRQVRMFVCARTGSCTDGWRVRELCDGRGYERIPCRCGRTAEGYGVNLWVNGGDWLYDDNELYGYNELRVRMVRWRMGGWRWSEAWIEVQMRLYKLAGVVEENGERLAQPSSIEPTIHLKPSIPNSSMGNLHMLLMNDCR